jgi:hypothetical protein
VNFKALSGHGTYELQWKEIQAPWEAAGSTVVNGNGKTKAVASPLTPGTTYCLRLVVLSGDKASKGQPGPELIIDTEQVGCTPKADKGCCIIQ